VTPKIGATIMIPCLVSSIVIPEVQLHI